MLKRDLDASNIILCDKESILGRNCSNSATLIPNTVDLDCDPSPNLHNFHSIKNSDHRNKLKIELMEQIPQFTFAEIPFTVCVALRDQSNQPYILNQYEEPFNIGVKALYSDTHDEVEHEIVAIERDSIVTGPDATCELHVKLSEEPKRSLTSSTMLQKYYFKLFVQNQPEIDNILVGPITIIKNKLEVQSVPSRPIPKEWYKDEGGRENCIEMNVHLLDSGGREVTSRRVKLRLLLLYENLDQVQNQEILKLSPDCKMVIDENGKAMLKLRIEEVSKNHQKQPFRIKVEPDTEDNPTTVDISSDVSPPISVFSKRIKKPKKHNHTESSKPSGLPNTTKGTTPVVQHNHCQKGAIIYGISRKMEYNGERFPDGQRDNTSGSTVHRKSNDCLVRNADIDNGHLGNSCNENEAGSKRDIKSSLENVLEWVGLVAVGLQKIRWEEKGNQRNPDGSSDESRLDYDFENPNEIIDEIQKKLNILAAPGLKNIIKCFEANIRNTLSDTSETDNRQFQENLMWTEKSPQDIPNDQERYQYFKPPQCFPPIKMKFGVVSNESDVADYNLMEEARNFNLNEPSRSSKHLKNFRHNSSEAGRIVQDPMSWDLSQHVPAGHCHREEKIDRYGINPPAQEHFFNQNNIIWNEESVQHLHQQDRNITQHPSGINSESSDNSRSPFDDNLNVHYILAKLYCVKRIGMLGFPAFDSKLLLVGFYNSLDDTGRKTTLVYTPINRIGVEEHELLAATNLLHRELSRRGQSVFYRHHYLSLKEMEEMAFARFQDEMHKMAR